jgi:hypothetical protein
MSDANTTDDANASELLDDDKLPAEYPPDEPMGVEEYGTTAAEQAVPEPLDERVLREEPDQPLATTPTVDDQVGRLVDLEPGQELDLTAEAVAREVDDVDASDLAASDLTSGDPTRRDVAQERTGALPAEEAAMHLTEDPPMGDGDGYVDDEPA